MVIDTVEFRQVLKALKKTAVLDIHNYFLTVFD